MFPFQTATSLPLSCRHAPFYIAVDLAATEQETFNFDPVVTVMVTGCSKQY
jgi:hypothetical protein